MSLLIRLLVLLPLLTLSACGWHLRGTSDRVALDSITLKGGSPEFALQMEQALEDDGVSVYDSAPLVLAMSPLSWDSRIVAVDTVGRAAETEVKLNLYWQVFSKQGRALIPRQSIGTSRRYQVSPDNATGASDENNLARADMQREMIARILRSLSTLAPKLEQP